MKHSKIILALLLGISILSAHAQGSDTLEIQRNEKGQIHFARFKTSDSRKLVNGQTFLKNVLQAKPDDEFRLTKETNGDYQTTHQRYQQYYKGVKVEGAEYLAHGKSGNIETINGNYQDISIPSIAPSLTEQQALSKALSFVKAAKYKWEDPAMEKFLKENTKNPNATYYPKGELVIT